MQANFARVVVGYISALHNFLLEEMDRVAPGKIISSLGKDLHAANQRS